jgi:TonB family protein
MNAVHVRGDWVGQIIDGRYPLLEWLGGSGTSGTFLTELDGLGSQKAALKLLPSSPQSEDRLAGWAAAAKLSHPHLARIHHFGRADVNENPCVYIVYGLAEELLSQIIPERPLTADEASQMLDPILNALDYLHKAGFVHGHLKPSNVLVVENDIQLSTDSLLPIGKPAAELPTSDIHFAPEIATGPATPRADIWSLGITLVEALTQQLPIWDFASDAEPVLPATIPAPFAEIARRCLHADPARRCTLADIRALFDTSQIRVAAMAAPAPQQVLHEQRSQDKPLHARMPFLPLVIGLVLLVAIVVGLRIHNRKTNTAPLQAESTRQAPAAEPESKPVQPEPQSTTPDAPAPAASASVSPSTTPSAGDVLSRDVPEVPQRASNTIHGTISVAVRVNVDPGGAVTSAEYATRGPSAYFARIALDSARNWKFKPPQQGGRALPSSWLLHYKFRRTGVDVTPTQTTR